MGAAKSKQMSETVNEALMEITTSYMKSQESNTTDIVDIGQRINLKGSTIRCNTLKIGQTMNSTIKQLSEFSPQQESELKTAISNGLDSKVNEKMTKDSGPLTFLSMPTDQSSKLKNKMKTIINDTVKLSQINEVIRSKSIDQLINAQDSKITALVCDISQDLYIEMIVVDIVKPILNSMKQTEYIQELESEKKTKMFNGMTMTQMVALVVSCIASVIMMMIALAMIKAFKSK